MCVSVCVCLCVVGWKHPTQVVVALHWANMARPPPWSFSWSLGRFSLCVCMPKALLLEGTGRDAVPMGTSRRVGQDTEP